MLAAIPAPWSGVKAGYVNNKITYRGESPQFAAGFFNVLFQRLQVLWKTIRRQAGRNKRNAGSVPQILPQILPILPAGYLHRYAEE